MFLFLCLYLLNLEVIHARFYKQLSNKNCIRLLPQSGCRGKILDREGNIIVDSKLSYDAMILPEDARQPDKALTNISRTLGVSFKDLKEVFKDNYTSSSMPVTVAKNIDMKKAIALEELKIDIPSIVIQPKPLRHYPYGRLACHVIGYINEIDHWRLTKLEDYGYKTKDLVGFGGVEEKYDYYLRQEEGGLSVEVDHRSRFMRVLGFRPPLNGKDIQLTLNLKIQKIAEECLADRRGCVILMEPASGEIITMASCPNFDPAVFVDRPMPSGQRKSSLISGLFDNSESPLVNRAISSAFPAGSTFKLIVATAALETKKINSATSFTCEGSTLIGRQNFACWDTHGVQNLLAAITHSCNVFFYRTGLLVGAQLIHDYALKFGLSKVTSFELPYEASGFVPSPLWRKIYKFKSWYDGDTANLSIGQGEVLVTPLQMCRMMAVFANRGYLVTPYVVKAIDGRDISFYQRKNTPLSIKESTIDFIRQGLKNVIADPKGTANVLSGLSVSVAGKTGTAQAPPGAPHGWFLGFFPFKNPEFVICVFIERGGSGYAASIVAKQIIEKMVNEGLI